MSYLSTFDFRVEYWKEVDRKQDRIGHQHILLSAAGGMGKPMLIQNDVPMVDLSHMRTLLVNLWENTAAQRVHKHTA